MINRGMLTLVAVVLIAMPAPLLSDGASSRQPSASLKVLVSALGDAIEYEATPLPILRYCPDNTCEVFRVASNGAASELADFGLIYLWYASSYEALKAWRSTRRPDQMAEAVNRYSRPCQGAGPESQAKCALVHLHERFNIRVSFARYDEGQITEEPIDLSADLKRLK